MKSLTVARFWVMYRSLPPHIREAAQKAYARFHDDPTHPGLFFKPLEGYTEYWSARVTRSYRVVGRRNGDAIIWFWIGSHAEFDRDFR